MKNEVFIDEQEVTLTLSKDVINKIFNEEKNEAFCNNLNASLGDVLLNKEKEFYTSNKIVLDSNISKIENAVKELTKPYREYLNKYFLSENLNFFLSNGCSIYAGAKAINQVDGNYETILENIKQRDFQKSIKEKIRGLKDLRPEQILGQLLEIQSYLENVEKNKKYVRHIKDKIKEVKKRFLENCVIPIDYTKNNYHGIFLKKIISRPSSLDKVNLFTINYDLLIEKTAEQLEIVVNNGFVGFHNRTFLPSAFKLNLFLKESNTSKQYPRSINLFKLHGSISWRVKESSQSNPYGLEEIQISNNKIDHFDTLSECIIYPIQDKKQYSLDLPYSELLRQFVENLHKPNSVLMVMGYSFLDEHINDLMLNALLNPDFHLIIFSYQHREELVEEQSFLKQLIDRSKRDPRITIFSGSLVGSFENIVSYLIPYVEEKDYQQIISETFKAIKEGLTKK